MEPASDHRPWPLPARRWVLAMTWRDLLFAHWPVPVAAIAASLPAGLEPDTFEGRAWLGVVPFRMSGIRPRWLPPLPGASAFPELNLRTYVRRGERPGVWFYSLDAASRLAVATARRWFHLPYVHAAMRCQARGEDLVYASRRPRAPHAAVDVRYRPTGAPFRSAPGSLEHWLTERYCLYAADRRGALLRGEIHHAPWPLQPAAARFERNELARAAAFELPAEEPHLLFARRLDVVAFAPRRVAPAG